MVTNAVAGVRPSDPLPDRGQPVMPSGGERAHRDREQAGQRIDPPQLRAGIGDLFQPRPDILPKALTCNFSFRINQLDRARSRARQCQHRHAAPPS
jgi:hypothetical protein